MRMENTRVYVDVKVDWPNVQLSLKNISCTALNISADELTERFIRAATSPETPKAKRDLAYQSPKTVQLQGENLSCILMGICLR